MRRRNFIAGLASTTAAWPPSARAQQAAMPVIGFLGTRAPGDDPQLLTEFRQGLKNAGYVEGQNVAMEYRFAENQYDRLPSLAADLVRRQVAVIVANGRAAQAAKEATATIPIAFVAGFDPVEVGLVASMNQPGGNITGVSILDVGLGPKRLQLLHELALLRPSLPRSSTQPIPRVPRPHRGNCRPRPIPSGCSFMSCTLVPTETSIRSLHAWSNCEQAGS